MEQCKKSSVSDETFDDFLAEQGLLQACEDHAIKEIIAERIEGYRLLACQADKRQDRV
ncbi:hypothetical protein [Methylovulum psychrotolerans]|jgi:hypothetical protein|uniref:Uncharacterized protein n=1 Tax=Methylovulum psychrotolerans TaxID=1704499 RepID=A0A2S5CNZ7_9GAMM|nr:hypothetical protein [Methylovulum psychrotolerans]POZ52462.1 hypothetical protein AADEFJLK_01944 [Methylovulum psychrotolerans]